MALIFPRVPIVFTVVRLINCYIIINVKFSVFTHKMKMPWQVSHWLVYAEWLSQCGQLDCRLS